MSNSPDLVRELQKLIEHWRGQARTMRLFVDMDRRTGKVGGIAHHQELANLFDGCADEVAKLLGTPDGVLREKGSNEVK